MPGVIPANNGTTATSSVGISTTIKQSKTSYTVIEENSSQIISMVGTPPSQI